MMQICLNASRCFFQMQSSFKQTTTQKNEEEKRQTTERHWSVSVCQLIILLSPMSVSVHLKGGQRSHIFLYFLILILIFRMCFDVHMFYYLLSFVIMGIRIMLLLLFIRGIGLNEAFGV